MLCRGGKDCPASPPLLPSMATWTSTLLPPPPSSLLHLPLKVKSHQGPHHPSAASGEPNPRGSWSTGQSRVPPTPPSLGALVETSLPWTTAERDLSRGARLGHRCCPSSSLVFNNTQPQALPCLTFSEDWLSGETFLRITVQQSQFSARFSFKISKTAITL